MLSTRFTELVGCAVPIQQAGMGAAAPPELAAAVSNAGGLGMIGAAQIGLNPTTLGHRLDRAHALTAQPFGVNFIVTEPVEPSDYALFQLAARRARVVELFLWREKIDTRPSRTPLRSTISATCSATSTNSIGCWVATSSESRQVETPNAGEIMRNLVSR